jgi:hypothetical protein
MTDCPVILAPCRVLVKLSSDPATQEEEPWPARDGRGTSAAFPEQACLTCVPGTADHSGRQKSARVTPLPGLMSKRLAVPEWLR